MKERNSRTHKARGVSLPPELDQQVEKRIESLKPMVKGFSHYIQLLVGKDLSSKTEKAWPFKRAGTQTSSQQEALAA